MKKLVIVSSLILMAIALVIGGCAKPAPAQHHRQPQHPHQLLHQLRATIELKMSTWPPLTDEYTQRGIVAWTKEIEQKTNGRVKITFFAGATLGAPPDHLDLVMKDTADIGWINPAFTPSVFPLTDIRNLPFLYPSVQVAAKVFWRQQEILNPPGVQRQGQGSLDLPHSSDGMLYQD